MLPDEQAYMRAQIHDNLRLRDTEDLLEIWQRADHEEWTDLAFEVVQEILVERLGEIPARKPVEQIPTSYYPGDPAQATPAEDIKKFMRLQTYETLDEKDTEELIDIWREANHREYNETAFDVVRQILLERIGELPAQEPVVREADEEDAQAGSGQARRVYLEVDPVGPSVFNLSVKPVNLINLHCPDCGKAISEQDRVCPQCGADLEAPLGESELKALAETHLDKAQTSYDAGRDFKNALAECDLALEFTPDSARAHNLRGLILDAQAKTALAVREYREALRLDPALAEARENLTDAEAELRKFKEEAGTS